MKRILIIVIIIFLIFAVWIINEIYSLAKQSGCSCLFPFGKCTSVGFITEDGQLITGIFHYWNPIRCIEDNLRSLKNEKAFMQKLLSECQDRKSGQ